MYYPQVTLNYTLELIIATSRINVDSGLALLCTKCSYETVILASHKDHECNAT